MSVKDVRKINTKNWQHKIGTLGEIATELEDIGQCIEVICTTQKGDVPHNPNLGCDILSFQDEPINLVAPKIRQVLTKEIKIQEPRAIISGMDFTYDDVPLGHLKILIRYGSKNTEKTEEREILLW